MRDRPEKHAYCFMCGNALTNIDSIISNPIVDEFQSASPSNKRDRQDSSEMESGNEQAIKKRRTNDQYPCDDDQPPCTAYIKNGKSYYKVKDYNSTVRPVNIFRGHPSDRSRFKAKSSTLYLPTGYGGSDEFSGMKMLKKQWGSILKIENISQLPKNAPNDIRWEWNIDSFPSGKIDNRFLYCGETFFDYQNVNIQRNDKHIHRIYMSLLFSYIKTHPKSNCNIGAMLVHSISGQVVAMALRYSDDYHAEVTLIEGLLANNNESLDEQYILYSTLRPCSMCAGLIKTQLPNTRVIYCQNDPYYANFDVDDTTQLANVSGLRIFTFDGENISPDKTKDVDGKHYVSTALTEDKGNTGIRKFLNTDSALNNFFHGGYQLRYKYNQYRNGVPRRDESTDTYRHKFDRRFKIMRVTEYLMNLAQELDIPVTSNHDICQLPGKATTELSNFSSQSINIEYPTPIDIDSLLAGLPDDFFKDDI